MTEVPEYLLERSRERRAALGLGGGDAPAASSGDGDAAAPAAATPAVATPAAPAAAAVATPAEPEVVVEPDPPWVEAAKSRSRIPMWVLPVLFLLPIWAISYVALLGEPAEGGPLVTGENVWTEQACANCHGSDGGGGVGFQISDGEVLLTFPEFAPLMEWLRVGADGFGDNADYGDPNRPGGAHNTADLAGVMPAFGEDLTPAELYALSRYLREDLAGEEISPEEELLRDITFGELAADTVLDHPADEVIADEGTTIDEIFADATSAAAEQAGG